MGTAKHSAPSTPKAVSVGSQMGKLISGGIGSAPRSLGDSGLAHSALFVSSRLVSLSEHGNSLLSGFPHLVSGTP